MDATIVWVESESEHAPARVVGADSIPAILQTWAQTRGLRLVAPREGGRVAISVDASIATHVEDELHAARELITQHDADGAERALARAEALLRAHPELPQGAWLLAEVERGWAARFARLEPTDARRAERHWRAAVALDGGRAAGIGEPSASPEAPAAFTLEVDGSHAAEIRWDGERIGVGSHVALTGTHQLVAKVDGDVVFAQWIAIAPGSAVRVALPASEACSRAELANAARSTAGIRCASWLLVHPSESGGFDVRVCSGSECAPELRVSPVVNVAIVPKQHHKLPGWVGWTLAGLGVVAAGVAIGVGSWLATTPLQTHTIFVQQ